ncbi:beta-ketoacyl-[acyl-carrier-protein] synthase family protein [Methyloparacoccus murrellii]|jgi:3-oxoacyl-[acyl-carrier-protein] synthase-1
MPALIDLRARYPELHAVRPGSPLAIRHYTLTNALGAGRAASLEGLRGRRSGLRPCDFPGAGLATWIGRVAGLETAPLPAELARHESRNHRLAWLALQQDGFLAAVAAAIGRHGAERVAVVMGTSTSGILETERAYRRRDPDSGRLPPDFRYRETQNTFAPADFVRRVLGTRGPTLTLSTACSSSAKVFASAARMLAAGWCDAAVVGGVDSLCLTTLYGFDALDLMAEEPCRPADAQRRGISIGEAAGFALLERARPGEPGLALLGHGESADAYHMSSPHPEGLGAALAMAQCLLRAGREPDDVDFTLLHGTATRANDSAEDRALADVLGPGRPCSSIKGWIGHTLGAAGIMNALVACLCLEERFAPPSLQTRQVDPTFVGRVLLTEERRPLRTVLSNAFGFGGSNACLLLGWHP